MHRIEHQPPEVLLEGTEVADLLSELVRTLHIVSSAYHCADLQRPFGIAMPHKPRHIRAHFVLRGEMWLELAGADQPVHAVAGDGILLFTDKPYRLLDGPDGSSVAWEDLLSGQEGDPRPRQKETDTAIVFGELSYVNRLVHPLFASLPELVHVSMGTAARFASLRGALRVIDIESQNHRMGNSTIINHLSEVIVIQVLCDWLDNPQRSGVVRARQDPRIRRVLDALHENPGDDWSLAKMASVAAMSRTGFATTFKSLLCVTPMKYLSRLRITVACDLLLRDELTLLEVAERVSFRSQAAFSQAFRVIVGLPPGQYRERARHVARQRLAVRPETCVPNPKRPVSQVRTHQNVRRGTRSMSSMY